MNISQKLGGGKPLVILLSNCSLAELQLAVKQITNLLSVIIASTSGNKYALSIQEMFIFLGNHLVARKTNELSNLDGFGGR